MMYGLKSAYAGKFPLPKHENSCDDEKLYKIPQIKKKRRQVKNKKNYGDISSFVTITENSTSTTVTIIENDSMEMVRNVIKENLILVKHNKKSDTHRYKSKDRTVTVLWYKNDKLVVHGNEEDRSRLSMCLVSSLKHLENTQERNSEESLLTDELKEINSEERLHTESEERDSEKRLCRHCSEHNLEIRGNIRKDGNCFFAAVSSQIEILNLQHHFKLDSINPQYLRQRVTDFIRNNRTIPGTDIEITGFQTVGDIDEYCDGMEKDGQWADHVAVYAMARMLRHDIKIIQSTPSSDDIKHRYLLMKGSEQPSINPLILGHIFELHYVSLHKKDEFSINQEPKPTPKLNEMSSTTKTSKEQIKMKERNSEESLLTDELKEINSEERLHTESEERDSEERLCRHCSDHNLEIRGNIRKDGNCFFAAVSSQIEILNLQHHFKLDSINPQYLRQRVTDFIRNNRTIPGTDIEITDFVGDIDEYCDGMEKDGQWADHVVIDAMARMLRHDIKILQSTPSSDDIKDRFSLIKGSEQPSGDPLILGHIFELHYVSLHKKDEFSINQEPKPTPKLNEMSSTTKTSKEQIKMKERNSEESLLTDELKEINSEERLHTESEERDSEERLCRHCSDHNLEIRGNIRKDGNCFFAAVSSQIEILNLQHHFKLDSINPQYLRQRVTDFIRNNRTIPGTDIEITGFVGDIDEYCDGMEKDGQWADHVAVVAMARMLRHDIKILLSTPSSDDIKDRFSLIKGSEQPSGEPLVLGHIFECHYVSLHKKDEFSINQEPKPTHKLNEMSSTTKTSKEQIKMKGNRKAEFFEKDTPHGFIKRYMYMKFLEQFIAETQDAGLVRHVYDVFAGEGSRYSNDWSPVNSNEGSSTNKEMYGSPVIALRVAIEYFVSVKQLSNVYNPCVLSVDNLKRTCCSELRHYSIRFCFVENGKKYFETLVNNIKLTLIFYNIDINIKEVKKRKNRIMEVEISSQNEDFPIFVCIKNDKFENLDPPDLKEGECMITFIDPYGYSQIPMKTVEKFIGPKKSVFINFMSSFVYRFRKTVVGLSHVTRLFDLSKELFDEQINEGKNLNEIYTERLKHKAKTKFALNFEVIDKFNQVLYYLIFVTNDYSNLKWMKKSFVYGSQFDDKLAFSDFLLQRRDRVMSLREDQDDHKAASVIFEHFCSQAKVQVEEIEKFIWCKTIFVWRQTLVELIQRSRRLLKVEDSTGNSINCSEFPHGALLSFKKKCAKER